MSNKSYVIFNTSTGVIVKNLGIPEEMLGINLMVGEDAVCVTQYADPLCQYVIGGVITTRPVMPIVPPVEELVVNTEFTITGIPVGAAVTYPGGATVVDDGFISWETDSPGTYAFTFTLFPYQEAVFYAEVT